MMKLAVVLVVSMFALFGCASYPSTQPTSTDANPDLPVQTQPMDRSYY